MSKGITISIITICYNNPDELIATLASVDRQSVPPYEHLVVDGSTDGRIADYLANNIQPGYRSWVSEKDHGIADAFNKGLSRAQGEIVNMLNAGDTYVDDEVLKRVTAKFCSEPQLAWLHGKFVLQRGGIWVTIGKPFNPKLLYRGMRSLSHQSMFVKRALHIKYGLYDTGLRNAMDYDFVCRIAHEPFGFISEPLVVFAPGGTTDRDYLAALAEGGRVYSRNFGFSWKMILWQWRLKLLHMALKSPAGNLLYKLKVKLKLENL